MPHFSCDKCNIALVACNRCNIAFVACNKHNKCCPHAIKTYRIQLSDCQSHSGNFSVGLKIRPDVFLHDICKRIFVKSFFIFSPKRNEKRGLFTKARCGSPWNWHSKPSWFSHQTSSTERITTKPKVRNYHLSLLKNRVSLHKIAKNFGNCSIVYWQNRSESSNNWQ